MNELLAAPSVAECEPEWQQRPVSALAMHISGAYHERMRDELPVLARQASQLSAPPHLGGPNVEDLTPLLSELRDEVETHAWTEDDLLFPVLVAREYPAILTTTLTTDAVLRLIDSLADEHLRIRKVLARLSAYVGAARRSATPGSGWADLLVRVARLRDRLLDELDLEDRCLLPRARKIAESDLAARNYR